MQEWIFNSGGCVASHDFDRQERIEFSNRAVVGFMEEMPVMAGISVYRIGAHGRGSFQIAKTPPDEKGRVILGCLMGGRGSWVMDGTQAQDWRDGGRAYSLTPVDREVRYDVSFEDDWCCVAVRLEGEALDTLGRDGPLPHVARAGLEGRLRNHSHAAPLPRPLRRLAHELMRPAYAGRLGRLYRQSKALEFTAHHLDCLAQQDATPEPLSGREAMRVRQARDRLVEDLRDPPSLDELAAAVNLTPRRLNAGFRAMFGTTVFDYLRDARMDAARRMLEEGLSVPLKQLAWSVGYGQATNFITAFRRRYGVSPARYRSGSRRNRQPRRAGPGPERF